MGRFHILLQDSGHLKDSDFVLAQKEGRLDELVDSLPVEQEAFAENTATHMMVIANFRKHFAGMPNGAYPMERVNTSILHHVTLLNWASEPYFAYWMSYYGTIHNPSGSVNTGNAGKRFYAHAIETYSEKDPTGREEVFARSRFLYLPSQVVSNQIRSLGVYWGEYVNDNNEDKGMVAWARMKDAGGFPLTLDKSASQTLLIQYTFRWVAL
jgi:hypothetical protein